MAVQEPLLVVLRRAVENAVRHQAGLPPIASEGDKEKAKLAVAEAKLAVAEEELAIAKAAGADEASREPLEVAVLEAKAGVADAKVSVAKLDGTTSSQMRAELEETSIALSKAYRQGAFISLPQRRECH